MVKKRTIENKTHKKYLNNNIKIRKDKNSTSFILPKLINLKKTKEEISAYRSNISNMFTENDNTLTTQGYLRSFDTKGYYGDVQKCITIEIQDDLVGGLIDTFVNTANTELNFNIPSDSSDELEVWEQWKQLVNIKSKTQLPGTINLNRTIMKSMIVTGLATVEPVWGEFTINRKKYILPTDVVVYPTLGIRLLSNNTFADQLVYMNVNEDYYKYEMNQPDVDVAVKTLYHDFGNSKKSQMAKHIPDAYAIKYNYTPNTPTIYPSPFLKRSFESIAMRHKMMDADMTLLEMIINAFIQIKIGDKDNVPKPTTYNEKDEILRKGDLEQAQTIFESLDGQFETIVTPYHYEIKVILPEGMTDLLNQSKYVESQYNILSNFGIIMDPSSNSNTVEFDKRSYTNFLKNCESLQSMVAGWYTWLANEVRIRNGKKIKTLPKMSFDKPELVDNDYLSNLINITDRGYGDVYTLIEKFNLDPKSVIERKKSQLKLEKENEGLFEPRATFAQKVVTDDNSNGGVTDERTE